MSRFNLRNRPRISYYEPDEPNLDEYIFCSDCGDFVYEFCSIHGPLLVIPDDKINDYNNKRVHVIDAEDANESNWMRYVNCSRHWYEQNLIAYQYRGQLYYRTIKIIPRYTELMVFYGSEFAHMLQINLKRYNAPTSYAQKFGSPPLKYSSSEEIKYNEISFLANCIKEKSTKTLQNTKNNPKLANLQQNKLTNDVSEKDAQSAHKKAKFIVPKKIQKGKNETSKISENRQNKTFNSKNITSIKNNQTADINLQQKEKKSSKSCDFNTDDKVNTKCLNKLSKNTNKNIVKTSATKEIKSEHENNLDKNNNINNKPSEENVNDSFESIRLDQNIFSCETCNFKTSFEKCLKTHLLAHGAETKYTCSSCDYITMFKGSLNSHMRTHTGERPYACKFCETKFNLKSDLIRHIRTHTGERPYACKFCETKFSQKSHLISHIRTHTGERPYACKFCDKKFNQKGDLNSHIRTHTGERPYACKFCETKFSQKSHLISHIRTHTGERPYACKFCETKFSQKSPLISHIRTHTGERPYACKFCEKKFSRKGSLNSHLRTHTGEIICL